MKGGQIVVLDYGMGNIHSILKALRLYHTDVEFTNDPEKIKSCAALVLPGDGAFIAAMDGLKPTEDLIRNHVQMERPILGVCIGFQVLFQDSSEVIHASKKDAGETSGDNALIQGLGLISGHIRKFQFSDSSTRVPHMGWNKLNALQEKNKSYLKEYMYFIHSYRAERVETSDVVAMCDYNGDSFAALVRRKSILACQFHPEKSGTHGLELLKDWVESS